jgi:hypothetical protein
LIRPSDEKEHYEGGHECIIVNQLHKQIIANNQDNLTFTFDEVLDKSATQLNVYESIGKSMINSVIEG